jgi:addiction module HigA family antidote
MVVKYDGVEAAVMRMNNPSHPGRLLAYYLQDKSVTEVARHLGVTRPALSRILNGKAGISADMALRISEAFNTEPDFWLRLQAQRDLWVASRKRRTKVKPLIQSQAA